MSYMLLGLFFATSADLHGLNLIHTDLKPENVLLVSSEYTKIVDHKVTLK